MTTPNQNPQLNQYYRQQLPPNYIISPRQMSTQNLQCSRPSPRHAEAPVSCLENEYGSNGADSFDRRGGNYVGLTDFDFMNHDNPAFRARNDCGTIHRSNAQSKPGIQFSASRSMLSSKTFTSPGLVNTPVSDHSRTHNPSIQSSPYEALSSAQATNYGMTHPVNLQALNNTTYTSQTQINTTKFDAHNTVPGKQRPEPTIDHFKVLTTNLGKKCQMLEMQVEKYRAFTAHMQNGLQKVQKENQDLRNALRNMTEEKSRWQGEALKSRQLILRAHQPRATHRMLVGSLSGQGHLPLPSDTVLRQHGSLPVYASDTSTTLSSPFPKPAAAVHNDPLAFVRPPRSGQAYPTPLKESPQWANTLLPSVVQIIATTTNATIDLTFDEPIPEPSALVIQIVGDITNNNETSSSDKAISKSPRENYVAAQGPNLGGPSKVPPWALQAKLDIEAEVKRGTAGSLEVATNGLKRKTECEQRPAKKAKTEQTRKANETGAERPKKEAVKKPRAPRKPKASVVAAVQSIQPTAPALSDEEEAQKRFEEEMEAALTAKGPLLAEEHESDRRWNEQLKAKLIAELEAMQESEAVVARNATHQEHNNEEPGSDARIDPKLLAIEHDSTGKAVAKEAHSVVDRPGSPADSLFDDDGEGN